MGNNPAANNATGFSAVPACNCYGSSFYGAGYYANLWSSTQIESSPSNAYSRYLYCNHAHVGRSLSSKYFGFSVRCLRDDNRSVGNYLHGVSEQIEAQQSVLDSLAPVAFSGDYNDLVNAPTIPAAQVNADWNATSGVEEILNKPTDVSAFNNDAGYITAQDIPTIPTVPTDVSAFNNDAGYITQTQLNAANYVTNSGTDCGNAVDLCSLLSRLDSLERRLQNMPASNNTSAYGVALNDTCPQRMVMINGSRNACYHGSSQNNVFFTVLVDGSAVYDATYTWYADGQLISHHDGFLNYYAGKWGPTHNNPHFFTSKVTLADGCSYLSGLFEVNVYDLPDVIITGNDSVVCEGENVTLRAGLRTPGNPMITFQWYENTVSGNNALPGRTHEDETFRPALGTTDYIVLVTHLMEDYGCLSLDTFRVEVSSCEGNGETSGTDTTQTSQHTISISLTTDNFGSETTWQVMDVSSDTILASGGPYSSNSIQDIPDVFVDGTGCYVFIIYDSYGDGIFGDGNYSVSYDSVVMGSGGGNSFSQVSYFLNPDSSPCPSDEISLTSLNISNYQALNNNFQIKGKVTNDGANAITSFMVKYRVDGGAWSSDYSVSCNIVPMGGTFNFTHDVPASIASTGQHTIDVMVYKPNGNADDETNNSISMNIEVNGIPDGDARPCPGSHTVSDIDNNVYNTVQIGNQCWLAENLRTTRYADGTYIPLGTDTSSTTAYRYNPSNNTSNVPTYGYLYNWRAVMHNSTSSNANPSGVQGICPTGWHVPSDAEWTQLTSYLKGHPAYFCEDSNRIAKALAGTVEWYNSSNDCAVGNDLSSNNTAGFSAMPAGYLYGSYYNYYRMGAFFWSATEASSGNMWNRSLYHNNATVNRNSNNNKYFGYSVRCLRDDNSTTVFPTVTTDTVSNVTDNSATCGGNVTAVSGTTVTARGVCWSTSPNPTLADSHTTDNSGTGSFTSNLTGLESYHIYYVRAYITTVYGTVYGEEVTFSIVPNPNGDERSCSGMPHVTDIDGNIYNTVQIGGQCWMRENLRTTKYADGSSITLSNSNNNTAYGLLYNWSDVMHGASSSDATPSGVQGICPDGWHVPSDAEWTQLTDYVSSQSDYVCNGDNTYIAKALASTTGWTSSSNTCSVGKDASSNNATGFNARAAGSYSTSFWCSTDVDGDDAWYREIYYSSAIVSHTSYRKTDRRSIRCLRNDAQSFYFPTVTTSSVANIAPTSATCGGNVSSNGGASVTERGVCWSTRRYPTIYDAHKSIGNGPGSFNSNITQLAPSITYYVRAYATNQYGTVYGNEVSFTTTVNPNGDEHSCSGTPIVTDVDGNVYNTVQIGGQCWMRENLRTTKYSDGTSLTYNSGNNTSYSTGYWYYPNGDSQNKQTYGLLYNWKAVMHDESSSNATPSGVQGICPDGWHLPSDAEWSQLADYVSGQSEYVCGNDNASIAKSLAFTTGWLNSTETCSVGNDQSSNNSTHFGAMPAGCLHDIFFNLGSAAHYWSATEQAAYVAYYRNVYSHSGLVRTAYYKYRGYSVRCLRDENTSSLFPTVTTNNVSILTSTSVTCGGNVTSNGGTGVIARGVCWSTSHNPTIADSHTADGSGMGSFTSSISGLSSNVTFYIRAYATNIFGTVYGQEVSFTIPLNTNGDEQSCPGTPTITDIDGNTYNTVQIGDQCWMRENLRTSKYADGTPITQSGGTSYTTSYWCYPGGDSSYLTTYGRIYNWPAVMHGATLSDSVLSNIQGICPSGWHVPSDEEWHQLADYVTNQSHFMCNGNVSIAKALASKTGWISSTSTCAVGNMPDINNATGFNAVPSGYFNDGFYYLGNYAYFWSSTEYNNNNAYRCYMSYSSSSLSFGNSSKSAFYSVRCLRD